jgi:hypothetical protein
MKVFLLREVWFLRKQGFFFATFCLLLLHVEKIRCNNNYQNILLLTKKLMVWEVLNAGGAQAIP